jgi:hypothetical protein
MYLGQVLKVGGWLKNRRWGSKMDVWGEWGAGRVKCTYEIAHMHARG